MCWIEQRSYKYSNSNCTMSQLNFWLILTNKYYLLALFINDSRIVLIIKINSEIFAKYWVNLKYFFLSSGNKGLNSCEGLIYSAIHRVIIVLKDRATHRVVKRIAPSLSLLNGPSLKIRKRTTFTWRFGKLFTPVLSLPAWIDYNRYQIAWRKLSVQGIVKTWVISWIDTEHLDLELFAATLLKSTY